MKFRILESITVTNNGVASDRVYKVQKLHKLFFIIPIWITITEQITVGEYYRKVLVVDREFKSVHAAEEYIRAMYKHYKIEARGRTVDSVVKYISKEDL